MNVRSQALNTISRSKRPIIFLSVQNYTYIQYIRLRLLTRRGMAPMTDPAPSPSVTSCRKEDKVVLTYDFIKQIYYATATIGPEASRCKAMIEPTKNGDLFAMELNISSVENVSPFLTQLDVSSNHLKSFKLSTNESNITVLAIGWNPITSFKDIEIPYNVQELRVDGTEIDSLDGAKFPSTMNNLDISSTKIMSLEGLAEKLPTLETLVWEDAVGLKTLEGITIPSSVKYFDFSDNPTISVVGYQFPAHLMTLELYLNQLTTLDGILFPEEMEELWINNNAFTIFPTIESRTLKNLYFHENPIEEFALTKIPPRVEGLFMQDTNIQSIYGVDFPPTLEHVNLTGHIPITHFEIPAKTLIIFQDLYTFAARIEQSKCKESRARLDNSTGFPLCVLPDQVFDELYADKLSQVDNNRTSSSAAGTSGLSVQGVVGILIFVIGLIGLIGFFLWRRQKSNMLEKEQRTMKENLSSTIDIVTTPSNLHAFSYQELMEMDESDLWSARDPEGALAIRAARIPLHQIVYGPILGIGGFGEVYQGLYKDKQVAIKRLLPEKRKCVFYIQRLLEEVKLMSMLDHPHILRLVGVAWDSWHELCVVTELMTSGDLRSVLIEYDQMGYPRGFDHPKVNIAHHVALALTYLHSLTPRILHRDLKAKNILLNEDLDAKICDFGTSREEEEEEEDKKTMTANVGTSFWMAPEVMLGERYNEKADIFSFGILLSEIDTHLHPYAHVRNSLDGTPLTDTALLQKILSGEVRAGFTDPKFMQAPSGKVAQDSIIRLARKCLALNPNERPSAVEASYQLLVVLRIFESVS